jgi:hypothetical protein
MPLQNGVYTQRERERERERETREHTHTHIQMYIYTGTIQLGRWALLIIHTQRTHTQTYIYTGTIQLGTLVGAVYRSHTPAATRTQPASAQGTHTRTHTHTHTHTYIYTYVSSCRSKKFILMMCSNIQAVLLNNIYLIYISVKSFSRLRSIFF